MKVAFLVGTFPVVSETFVVNQAVGLLEQGHEVSIFALDGPPKDGTAPQPDVLRYGLLERTRYAPPMPHGYLPRLARSAGLLARRPRQIAIQLRSLSPLVLGWHALSLKPLFATRAFLDAGRFDVAHGQFGPYGLTGVRLRRAGALRGARVVTTFRGFDVSRYVRERGPDCYRELFRRGDFFLANCDYFRERAIALGCDPTRIVTHRSGIDVRRFPFAPRSAPLDGRVRIASVGRLVEKKGFEYALRAVSRLVQRGRQVAYRIVGDGPLRPGLERLTAQLGLGEVVEFAGAQPHPVIVETLRAAHLFVAPSVAARNGDEDAPVNTLKEAMATGLPVVGTLHGGIPELVRDGVSGFLVPERDDRALAAALDRLVTHPEAWPAFGRAGRAEVERRYDRARLNAELVRIYEAVLEGDGRRGAAGV